MSTIFDSIKSLVPKRSRHILHNYHGFDASIGLALPFYQRDVVPGDNAKLYLQSLIREKPLVAPVMGEKDIYFRFFFVPYRILDEHFEEGITGGDDGTVNYTFPTFFDDVLAHSTDTYKTTFGHVCKKYSLWDCFGFALPPNTTIGNRIINSLNMVKIAPSSYLWRAYYSIWNNYFRDEELQEEVNPFEPESASANDFEFNPLPVNYARDYFTSAALAQQKGIAPSFSISGIVPIDFINESGSLMHQPFNFKTGSSPTSQTSSPLDTARALFNFDKSNKEKVIAEAAFDASLNISPSSVQNSIHIGGNDDGSAFSNGKNYKAVVDLSGGVGFDVAELRQLVQIQKILERASRTGSRYTEWLRSFFSVAPSDARLNRPEYIGGYRQSMINSEVLQTSNASTPTNSDAVGAMKGHGISASSTFIGSYFVKEYGVIMGIMYCRPRVSYTQGVNRQWIKKGRYDFYLPQLCNLSEQGIFNAEIYYAFDKTSGDDKDDGVWSFQGAWSEMRSGTSVISGAFRDELNYWNYGRTFASRPENNSNFISVNSSEWQRFYVEQTTPQLYCETDVTEDIVRPITMYPEPGRLDHDM